MIEIQAVRGQLLSFKKALIYLGMDEARLRRLVAAKKIPVIRDGRLGFYTADLDEWIVEHRTPAAGPLCMTLPAPGRQSIGAPTGIDDILDEIRKRRPSPFDVAAHGTTGRRTAPRGDRRGRRSSAPAATVEALMGMRASKDQKTCQP